MKMKHFNNGNQRDGRSILIVIEPEYAMFYFYDRYIAHRHWVEEETERREYSGEEPLTDEEKNNAEFYWIGKDDWNYRLDEWEEHLGHKAWFTSGMLQYLNENLTNK